MLKSEIYVPVNRRNTAFSVVILLFLILFVKLYSLMIHSYEEYRSKADYNRIRPVVTHAPRGNIYDRHGNVLAANSSVYAISVIRDELTNPENELSQVSGYLNIPVKTLKKNMKKYGRGRFLPSIIARDVQVEILGLLEEHKNELPGVIYSTLPVRYYPMQDSVRASHVLGYLREIGPDELSRKGGSGYSGGDFIGVSGLEHFYEFHFKGNKGHYYQQVDAFGREAGKVSDREPVPALPGNDLYLTIDSKLQADVEKTLEGLKASSVVLNASTGEVLAMVSKPDFRLSDFAGFMETEEWQRFQNSKEDPFLNRAITGRYPPGSAMKLVTAIAGLEEKLTNLDWTVECTGSYHYGDRVFRCWKEEGHGKVNISKGVKESCNIYFYQLIQRMDIDIWYKYANLFGFGSKTGIDLPQEKSGIAPNRKFMNRKYGKRGWTKGTLLNISIGQGDLLVTPLQMARFSAILATKGKKVTPWLASRPNAQAKEISLKKSTWDRIHKMMFNVVNTPGGTAYSSRIASTLIKFYGKTGTAQNPRGEAHAWFIGFATKGSQTISISVIVENGGSGGTIAAPLASKIIQSYFIDKS
ncbi:MAG: penicillin-binding protein 2 [Candidatus Neomarinimicrobiota bacterium]|jgi:penicillin-binding protein 2|nr:penicillin-binding protein 2 [Candidatus Neomarinimicrobiota bacterium]